MGAMQLRLACALGLREDHKLLDFGCGSLRAGRLFIPYLGRGNYFGIEPNQWLVERAIEEEGLAELVRLRDCHFDDNDRFDSSVFGESFDYIFAQSIFSHASRKQIIKCLDGFRSVLKPGGIIAATFILTDDPRLDYTGDDWVYPGCVGYVPSSIAAMAGEAGLVEMEIPWFHPRQVWFLFAASSDDLPSPEESARHLTGVLLRTGLTGRA